MVRLVAFGGGTGLPVLLAGLGAHPDVRVTAVATVADDGGSSGRLRRELAIAPPGDLRNCLVALAADREAARLFAHRFDGPGPLAGHTLGNLILAAAVRERGDLTSAVAQVGRRLRVRGQVLPAATDGLRLRLQTADGTMLDGESTRRDQRSALITVATAGANAPAPPALLGALREADAVVLSAGSLFTSTIAALLGTGTRAALRRFAGPVVYVANLQPERGETDGFSVTDHVAVLVAHAGPVVTDVLVDASCPVDRVGLARISVTPHVVPGLADARDPRRHDPDRVAAAVLRVIGQRRGTRNRSRAVAHGAPRSDSSVTASR